MGKKAEFIYGLANEEAPRNMSKDFKDALAQKKKYSSYKSVEEAVFAFFENYPDYPLSDEDKKAIAQAGPTLIGAMPTPRY